MEELKAIREAQEAALRQAELAAQEAAANLNIFDEDDLLKQDNDSLVSEEVNIRTPSTRTLSREKSTASSSAASKSPFETVSGMTNSAIMRHVSHWLQPTSK